MSVRDRDGRLTIDYYPTGRKGRRIQMRLPAGTSHDAAKQIECELLKRRKNQSSLSLSVSINKLIKDYYNHIQMHLAISTVRDIKNCFKNHILPYFGRMHPSEITTHLISSYQQHRQTKPTLRKREQKAMNRSINKETTYLSGLLKWAARETGSQINMLRFRPLPYKRPLPNILTQTEIKSILQKIDDHYRGIVIALAQLGLRITSARMLKLEDVDMKSRCLRAYLKGGREIVLPISDELYNWIKKRQKQNTHNSQWLFPSKRRPLYPIVDIRNALAKACKQAGIKKKVNPHLFRHCAAAHLIESGIDVRTVQELLGHTDIRMTTWYTQIAMKTKRSAMIKAGHIKV